MTGYGAVSRQKEISDLLRTQGKVSVTQLAETLGVSVVTIRNDLEALEQQQVLRRLRGGAVSIQPPRPQRAAETASGGHEEERQRIGAAAAGMVHNGETVIIDAGNVALAMARALPHTLHDVAVVTNSLDVALELEGHHGVRVVVTGGTLAKPHRHMISPFGTTLLRQINADLAFIACAGVDAKKGFTTPGGEEAEIKQAIAAAAARVVFLADHAAIGHVAAARILDIGEAEALVTDNGASAPAVRALEQAGLKVITT
jgi:DeoR family transcriptional regulator of aga operon